MFIVAAQTWIVWGKKKDSASSHCKCPPRESEASSLYISTSVLGCSLRCFTYGKQWISQYTVCLQNMFWLTFHWSRLSLELPEKIVAVQFGCLPVWIYWEVSLCKGLVIGLSGSHCSLLLVILPFDFCMPPCASAHPQSWALVIQEVREICREEERTGSSKAIPMRVVSPQCEMYNTCTGVCNKRWGSLVESPTGRPWSSAPRQANPIL